MACPTFTKSPWFRSFALVVFLVIAISVFYALSQFNKKHEDLSSTKPEYSLNASDLFAEFETDEVSATSKYAGKVLELTGRIAQAEYSSMDSTLSITLKDADQLSGVICTFPGKNGKPAGKFDPGSQIRIRGEFSGMLMDVLLNNCVIVE